MSVRERSWKTKDGSTRTALVAQFVHVYPDKTKQAFRLRVDKPNKKAAEQWERDFRANLDAEFRTHGHSRPVEKADTLADFRPVVMQDAEEQNKGSWAMEKERLYDEMVVFFGETTLPEITATRIGELRTHLTKVREHRYGKGRKLAPASVNKYLAVLRRSLQLALVLAKIPGVPPVGKVRDEKGGLRDIEPDDYLSFEEADALIAASKGTPLEVLILTALKSGLRIGELQALKWKNVDLDGSNSGGSGPGIFVRETLTKKKNPAYRPGADESKALWVEGPPKGNRARRVGIGPRLAAALKAHRHLRGPYVFCDEDGSRTRYDQLKDALRRLGKDIGLSKLTGWHILRHTYGSHASARGASVETIQLAMGHSTILVTRRYMHVSGDQMARLAESMG